MRHADDHLESDQWLLSHLSNSKKIMVVEFNTGGANFVPVQQASAPQTEPSAAGDSSVSFSSQSLQQTLKESAQARPEKVARANALLSDGAYPSDAALDQLAGFLARRL